MPYSLSRHHTVSKIPMDSACSASAPVTLRRLQHTLVSPPLHAQHILFPLKRSVSLSDLASYDLWQAARLL